MELLGTTLFALAILHTFSCSFFQRLSARLRSRSVAANVFHLLGEVEIVFGVWAGILFVAMGIVDGFGEASRYLEGLKFTEPLFVFVVMTIAATRPVLRAATLFLGTVARALPLPPAVALFAVALSVGPLLGSLITEPAAMTITALLLKESFFDRGLSTKGKYLTLGVLFVNVSVGGVLTHFAAPPVLMVADTWGWTTPFMASTFGVRAVPAVLLNTVWLTAVLWRELRDRPAAVIAEARTPWPLMAIHLAFLALVVFVSHHPVLFLWLFLFFLGVTAATQEYQDEMKLRDSLLVAFFLGGLVVLGGLQSWWLQPIVERLGAAPLFLSTTALTAFTDNAALTYLGAQLPGITDASKYALMAGAIAGGGLTVIANAPNPAGYAILRGSFGEEGISAGKLCLAALAPTLVAMAAFWFL